MVNDIHKELKEQFRSKISTSEELFNNFCNTYIIDNINDSDLLKEINKNNRDITKLNILDYLQNDRVLLRTIKVLVLLELSKDFKEFQKLNKKIKVDKNTDTVEFDKVLLKIINGKG